MSAPGNPVRPPDHRPALYGPIAAIAARPASLFVILSVVFGLVLIAINPPLRGPDEQAHFLRIYGYAAGDVVPSLERDGKKGIALPADIYRDYAFFENAKNTQWKDAGYRYADIFRAFSALPAADAGAMPVFVPYQGTEGYSPAAYLPEIAVTALARAAGLDFLTMLYLMRLSGFAMATAIMAWSIALVPRLKWAFFLIGMLPAAIYGRAVAGADSATVSLSFLVTALSLRAALGLQTHGAGHRALWMTLCVLSKPPQAAFILLEGMASPLRALSRRWKAAALVVLPGLLLAPLWILAVDAQMGAWRLTENSDLNPDEFRLLWKLGFMLEHPLRFPALLAATVWTEGYGLWRQLVGVLGWLDTPLRWWVYPALTALLVMTMLVPLNADRATRLRSAFWCGLMIAGYTVAVFLILYITWTPAAEPVIWGVQGRYFVGVLPALAIAVSALMPRGWPAKALAACAIGGALLGGIASIEAVWRVNWFG